MKNHSRSTRSTLIDNLPKSNGLGGVLSVASVFLLALSSSSQSQDIASLHRLCAINAVIDEPAKVLGVRFDIITADEQPTARNDNESKKIRRLDDDETPFTPYISYEKCHVRLLSDGRMKTKHFKINKNNTLTEYRPEFKFKRKPRPKNKVIIESIGKPLASDNSGLFENYFSDTQKPLYSSTSDQSGFVEPINQLVQSETNAPQSVATVSISNQDLPTTIGEPLSDAPIFNSGIGQSDINRSSDSTDILDSNTQPFTEADITAIARAEQNNQTESDGGFFAGWGTRSNDASKFEGVKLQSFDFTQQK